MNLKLKEILLLFLLLLAVPIEGKDAPPTPTGDMTENNKKSERVYRMIVHENTDDALTLNNEGGMQRSIVGDAWKAIRQSYTSTFMGQLASTSSDILSAGINLLVDKLRSHNPDWMAQLKKDCTFSKTIPMPQEIANFYSKTSNRGSTDPEGIIFDGFGCQQYIQYVDNDSVDANGKKVEVKRVIPVFDIRCSLRKDEMGKIRMLHHGKFEVLVDYVYVNPLFCDLPNDSLTSDKIDLQTPFGFDKRQNLNLNVNAVITSSWMNQATQIYNDQQLGEFSIKICIPDSTVLEKDGPFKDCFVYVRPDSAYMESIGWDYETYASIMKKKQVSVIGESFLVPRSFIGTDDGQSYSRTWGTGQYKVNMTLTETCDVKMGYYCTLCHEEEMKMARLKKSKDDFGAGMHVSAVVNPPVLGQMLSHKGNHKWNNRWKEEWDKMKKRRKNKKFFTGIWDNIRVNYQDYKWVYTMLTPVANAVLEQENKFVAKQLNKWFKLGDNMAAGGSAVAMPNGGGGAQSGGGTKPGNGGGPSGGGKKDN